MVPFCFLFLLDSFSSNRPLNTAEGIAAPPLVNEMNSIAQHVITGRGTTFLKREHSLTNLFFDCVTPLIDLRALRKLLDEGHFLLPFAGTSLY